MRLVTGLKMGGLTLAMAGCQPAAQELAVAADPQNPGWELVWSDEFDGDALDRTNWTPEQSCWGGGNDERQCYTDRDTNIEVSGGTLKLKARAESFTGPDRPPEIAADPNPQVTQDYTSGKVRTRDLHAWKYGKVEFRAKVPSGQGTWPAIWMMPADDAYGSWPLSGEIDILEAVNVGAQCDDCDGSVRENRTVSALHFGPRPPDNDMTVTRVALPDRALPSDEFHVWTLEWGEGLMRFYLDGALYWQLTEDDWYTPSPLARGRQFAPFDQPFYIMANLAVGGRFPETTNEKRFEPDSFPARFEIDWIRIYQCGPDRETGLACMD